MKVKFTTTLYGIASGGTGVVNITKNINLLKEKMNGIFEVDLWDLGERTEFSITSSADAFVRFQVAREKLGLIGRWAILNVEIIETPTRQQYYNFISPK